MVKCKRFMFLAGFVAILLFICSESYGQMPRPVQLRTVKKIDTRPVLRVARARKLPKGMSKKNRLALKRLVRNLKVKNTAGAIKDWNAFSRSYFSKRTKKDVNTIISWILRESYLETNKNLAFYADKVRYFNEQKQALRKYLNELRHKSSKVRGTETVKVRPVVPRNKFQKGRDAFKFGPQKRMNKLQTKAAIGKIEQKLATIGDDAQLANIDLQNMLQKAQQTLQLMSNVSKMLHDTAMSIIRKIG